MKLRCVWWLYTKYSCAILSCAVSVCHTSCPYLTPALPRPMAVKRRHLLPTSRSRVHCDASRSSPPRGPVQKVQVVSACAQRPPCISTYWSGDRTSFSDRPMGRWTSATSPRSRDPILTLESSVLALFRSVAVGTSRLRFPASLAFLFLAMPRTQPVHWHFLGP